MSDGGKGDAPRPFSVPQKEFDKNWDAIFKKKPEPKEVKDEPRTENHNRNN